MQVIERGMEKKMASLWTCGRTTMPMDRPTIFIQLLLLLHRRAIHQHSTPRREDAMREGDTQARRRRRNRIVDLKHLGVCTVASKKI